MLGDIHLSWSPLQLYMALVALFIVGAACMAYFKTIRKTIAIAVLASVVGLLFSAFDVGTRQADLGRHKFDVETPTTTIDKVESTHNTATSINKQFNETTQKLKETK